MFMATALNSPTLMSLFTTGGITRFTWGTTFLRLHWFPALQNIVLKSLFFNIGNHLKFVIWLIFDADVDFDIGFELLHCVLYLRILCAGF